MAQSLYAANCSYYAILPSNVVKYNTVTFHNIDIILFSAVSIQQCKINDIVVKNNNLQFSIHVALFPIFSLHYGNYYFSQLFFMFSCLFFLFLLIFRVRVHQLFALLEPESVSDLRAMCHLGPGRVFFTLFCASLTLLGLSSHRYGLS